MKRNIKEKVLLMIIVTFTIIAFLLFGLNNLVSATDFFKQGNVNLFSKPCIFNQTWCSASAVCNITLIDTSGKALVSNQMMTNHISYHSYILPNLTNGDYKATMMCIDQGFSGTNSFDITINPTGGIVSSTMVAVYILFLLVCITLIIFSIRLIIKNPYGEDIIKGHDKYEMKKDNKFKFYLYLLKKKLWIVGVFGVYLSLFLFTAVLNQISYELGISSLNIILIYVNQILAWLSIPFVLFWFAYIIIYFFLETEEILKYQFMGAFRER